MRRRQKGAELVRHLFGANLLSLQYRFNGLLMFHVILTILVGFLLLQTSTIESIDGVSRFLSLVGWPLSTRGVTSMS